MSAELIITETCGVACLFKICTVNPDTRLKTIQTIPWIRGPFQKAVSSKAHRHIHFPLLSFSVPQATLSVHLRRVLHHLLFSPSFVLGFFFFLFFFLPRNTNFTERFPAKDLCPQGSVFCRAMTSYDRSSFCCFSYFIIQMSLGPELMHTETSSIFWCMGDHNASHILGTYLAGQEDVWKCHRFEPCCSTCS